MKIEITLDIPCVWSYFAFNRLRRAAARVRAGGGTVDFVLHPYQLAPEAGTEGEPKSNVLRRAFGDGADAAVARITALAAAEGLEFDHDRALWSNTFEAHRLIADAGAQGRAEAVVERLFRAHHTDGLNIADPEVLRRIAAEFSVARRDGGADELRAALERVRREDLPGIPLIRLPDGTTTTGTPSDAVLHHALDLPEHAAA
ncbi:DsbA family protein [Streptomyces sp. Isolate_45]|uniref:DsbA family protein n=1 Tax=Streptomyces sp. Isolate_45 TaxID=2950111 RepID=UPI002481B201|nr:DsbA family protein [Streptomyces sp. Isolate_45]MDA5283835.1 DsbA family protein [Streptomyces sp. Isolate_45]